ncbi:MAG: zinc-dependent metalloprotease [Solirubrobacteraceae bacterium]
MIDWIVAERLAALLAGRGDAPAPPSASRLARMAADAETRVTRYTGLTPSRPLPAPEAIGRAEWIAANASSMRRLLGPVLERAEGRLTSRRGVRPAMSLTMSLVVTTEVGVVLGFLAQRVLGQYELVLLDDSDPNHGDGAERPPRLLFVLPNLGSAVESLDAPEDEFLTWVTLHEVTHAVQFAGVPWLQGYLAGLVAELMRSAEVRMDGPRTLRLPSRAQLGRSLRAARSGDIVGVFASPGERATLDKVQAAMAVVEGHAEHVMDAVAPDLLPSLARLRSAMDRRRRSRSGLAQVLGKLLGMEMKLQQYEQGKAFCDAVVEHAGPRALPHLFSSPEALPTLDEITDPGRWIARSSLDGQVLGR